MPFLPHRKCFLYQSCVFCPKYPISIFFNHFLSHFSSFLPHYWLRFPDFSVLPPFWKYLSLSNTSFYVMSDARHSGGRREAEGRQNEGRTKARLKKRWQKDIITRMPHTSSFDTFFPLVTYIVCFLCLYLHSVSRGDHIHAFALSATKFAISVNIKT